MDNKIDFPAWYYGPNGQSAVFESLNDVPKGWVDNPNKLSGVADETGNQGESNSPATTDEAQPTKEQLVVNLQKKSMGELWKMAKELSIDKSGTKSELINRIADRLLQ